MPKDDAPKPLDPDNPDDVLTFDVDGWLDDAQVPQRSVTVYGRADLLVGGNLYGVPPVRGRYDASYGLFLRGDGAGRFQPVDLEASGVVIEGQVRGMSLVRSADGGGLIVVARNDDVLQVLRPRAGSSRP